MLRQIPGCEINNIKRKAIERLALNIKQQSQEIEEFAKVLATMNDELDLARVTLYILENKD